jgi:t-SNARE complex subunit (syntaxin)
MLMSIFDIEVFVKDLDKLFNDMQDKAIAGSENVATASWVIKNQANYIKHLEEGLDSSINLNKAQAERQKNDRKTN